jgi:mycothiol system anti-sigma-R factor
MSGDGQLTVLRCAGIQRFVDTYLDGEFAERDRAEFEAHVGECESCRRKVKQQAEWKVAIKAAAPREQAPAALRNRVLRAVAKEAQPERSWSAWAKRVLPVAAAVGLVGSFAVSQVQWSPVAADVIAKHQRNLPIEVSGGTEQVRDWYAGKVDFPVRPPRFAIGNTPVALRGGRLTNVGDRQAAYLVYDINGSKVSVFIFDPGKRSVEAPHRMVIGNREVFLDQERGYSVVLYRDRGVEYAITSDLDSDQMLKLVSSAVGR